MCGLTGARGRSRTLTLKSAEREELTLLRKENRVLKMERDLLKEATAFFARENA